MLAKTRQIARWKFAGVSVTGPAHFAAGTVCQDCRMVQALHVADEEYLIACVADGAGTATHGGTGAKIACDTIQELASNHLRALPPSKELTNELVLAWIHEARNRIGQEARQLTCEIRELATTLAVAIIGDQHSHFFQIGDGAIIAMNHGACGVVFWPQSGEYANSTNFLTGDGFEDQIEFLSVNVSLSYVALMTDGLERMALLFNSRTPHPPFFLPLFNEVRDTVEPDLLNEEMKQFLESSAVRTRSDDDKTLIIASRTPT